MTSSVHRILIAGAGTAAWWNWGDEAILYTMLQELRTQFPDVEIGVISANPKGALDSYGVKEIPISDVGNILEFAQQSDLLILGGGGLFYDYWGFTIENLLTSSQTITGVYVSMALLAKLLDKPLMIYAVGVGPLFYAEGKHYTRLVFEQAHGIAVRDNKSKEILISLGISPEKIHVTADPVWAFPEVSLDFGKTLIQHMGIPASTPILGVSVRPWSNPNGETWEPEVARALDDFIEQYGGVVIFIPFHKDNGVVDDYAQSEKICKLMKHATSTHVLDANLSIENKASTLRQCDLILGMRLHANILAMRYGIPSVGLEYDPKIENLFVDAGKAGYALDLRLVSAESLSFVLGQAYKEKDSLRESYKHYADLMFTRTKENLQLAVEITQVKFSPKNLSFPANAFDWVQIMLLKQSKLLAERDQIITGLHTQMAEMTGSVTWKLAQRLLRVRLYLAPEGSLRERILRSGLRGLQLLRREGIVAFFRTLRGKALRKWQVFFYRKSQLNQLDLSWEDFQSKILSNRHLYRGVFVQEPIIDWAVPLYQRPQHIASALGMQGYLVIYKTPSVLDRVNGFREVSRNVWLTNLPVMEFGKAVFSVYSTAYATANQIITNGISKDGIFVYEYIDHISSQISGDDENIRRLMRLKQYAFQKANFSVTSARLLEQEAIRSMGRNKVLYIPNGVDVHHYRNSKHKDTRLPKSLLEFRKKFSILVGYFGAIAPWLWYEVIDELVKLRPDVGFVFIGPDYNNGISRLPRKKKNLLYMGQVGYEILPAYARLFDVCTIPFAPGEIAKTTSPLKLFEYFALEKPVVVTSFMDECVAFTEVFSGDSVQSISEAIDAAFKIKDDSAYKERLALLADRNSWSERAQAYEAVFSSNNQSAAAFLRPEYPLSHIQYLVMNFYKRDGLIGSYYETTHSRQEYFYWHPVLDWIMEMPSVLSIIDMGTAYGTLLIFSAMNKKAKVLHAIDPVGSMPKALIKEFNIVSHSVGFEYSEFEHDEKFDLVILTEVIEHLNSHPQPILQKARQLMHKDSYLILSTPDANEWGRTTKYYPRLEDIPCLDGQTLAWVDDHIWRYEKEELDEILERNGFQVKRFSYASGVSQRHLCYLLQLA